MPAEATKLYFRLNVKNNTCSSTLRAQMRHANESGNLTIATSQLLCVLVAKGRAGYKLEEIDAHSKAVLIALWFENHPPWGKPPHWQDS